MQHWPAVTAFSVWHVS